MHKRPFWTMAAGMTCVLLGACGGSGGDASDTAPDGDDICIPSRAVYDTVAQRMLAEHCGNCHGDEPDFGAPYGLTDYDDLIAGEVGARKIDRMVARMADKTMPPAGTTQVPHFELDTLVGWASCGLVHPDESVGLNVSAPIFEAPDEAPDGTDILDLLAPEFSVSDDTLDLYQCFTFEVPFGDERFLRRIEAVVDDSRVLHHIILLRDVAQEAPLEPHICDSMAPQSEYLYAWAPGTGPIQFPDGGLRIQPGDRFVLQIHYNNGAGIEGVQDSSGIRLYHAEPGGKEYGMFSPGPMDFSVPAGTQTDVEGACVVEAPAEVFIGMPHMHELGESFRQDVLRSDGSTEPLIELTGWSFESQFFYDTPFVLNPGDTLQTTCTFDNPGSQVVSSGNGTKDEMCFNFMYVTPPPPARFCDGDEEDMERPPELEYEFGACVPAEVTDTLEPSQALVGSDVEFGEPPTLEGGALPEGIWILRGAGLWLASNESPRGTVAARTEIEGAGLVFIQGDRVVLDFAYRVEFEFADDEIEETATRSVAGVVSPEGNALNLAPDCGEGLADLQFEATEDRLTLRFSGAPVEGLAHTITLDLEPLR